MNFFSLLLSNQILITSCLGWLLAQVIKTIIHFHFTKSFVPERLVGSGGMPSAHSATVCSLSTAAGIVCGIDSPMFAICTMFAIVVMYDAMGVRRETGIQAKVINEMMELFSSMDKELTNEERLKELVGHTPLQVIVGALLGIIIAFLVNAIFYA